MYYQTTRMKLESPKCTKPYHKLYLDIWTCRVAIATSWNSNKMFSILYLPWEIFTLRFYWNIIFTLQCFIIYSFTFYNLSFFYILKFWNLQLLTWALLVVERLINDCLICYHSSRHTSKLENFNSMLLKYASKRIAFSQVSTWKIFFFMIVDHQPPSNPPGRQLLDNIFLQVDTS